jgi:predicted TIM-barrel fold metal-dependent hydrolase
MMTTRRHFLKTGTAAAATGVVFCSCGLLTSAHAQQPPRQKLPVMVAGKRIKTIDVHSHCVIREAAALLGPAAPSPVKGADEAVIELEKRLAAMDAQAVDMEVVSINPNWYDRERDLAAQIVKIQNEKLAELCASKPDRFAAFASLTLQAPDLAVQELETAVKKQGLKGAAIGGTVNGMAFSDAKFHPVWARRKNSACPCSSIRKASLNSTSRWRATAGSPTPSVILRRRRSRFRISSSEARSTVSPA